MNQPSLSHQLSQNAPTNAGITAIIEDIASACCSIAAAVREGAFENNLGAAESVNVQGETQKTLDIIANDIFVQACSNNTKIAALISEEVEDVIWLKDSAEKGDYLIYFDPLDGSSNLEVDLSVGSIFSIVQIKDGQDMRDVMRKGTEQICAGYAIYGPSTMLVLTMKDQVDGFTFNEKEDAFLLTHPKLTIPVNSSEYAINASRSRFWDTPIRQYVDECMLGKDGPRARNFNMRWTASMVADVHRILMRGGVFMYPMDSQNADKGGKLRLLYEANPMSAIVEKAGGAASTGTTRIVEIQPNDHHQRVPVILGSRDEVERIVAYHTN